ncbi:uncharacterized protein LOC130440616 [Diorhabda sublineata]|uniref:uncharacterized protein LOC130440616 n=1 Tax=Diorhabda sublineata TaxID=1163346 RepID=UPI0024E08C05|nr:uncharacterized protein LOC130440616 [Diorhabda sublineata]
MTKVKAGDTYTKEIPTPEGHNKRISMVCYADYAAIFAETQDDLQRQLHKFSQVIQAMNMTISPEKTKNITFAEEPVPCKLVVQDKIIEQVSQFRYLGMDLSSYHDPVNDLRSQINKATAISGSLRQTIWANEYMRKDSKLRIYKTDIRNRNHRGTIEKTKKKRKTCFGTPK